LQCSYSWARYPLFGIHSVGDGAWRSGTNGTSYFNANYCSRHELWKEF
jgi:hypothetical protein